MKQSKHFTNPEKSVKAWATIDSEVGVVGVFETRREARESKSYAESHGHKQKVAKLTFDKFVR